MMHVINPKFRNSAATFLRSSITFEETDINEHSLKVSSYGYNIPRHSLYVSFVLPIFFFLSNERIAYYFLSSCNQLFNFVEYMIVLTRWHVCECVFAGTDVHDVFELMQTCVRV